MNTNPGISIQYLIAGLGLLLCALIVYLIICIPNSIFYIQELKVKISVYDGIVILGYVDNGGLSNFTGPNINLVHNNSKFIIGALPSLRYKKGNSTSKKFIRNTQSELDLHTVTSNLHFKSHFIIMLKQQRKMVIGKLVLV